MNKFFLNNILFALIATSFVGLGAVSVNVNYSSNLNNDLDISKYNKTISVDLDKDTIGTIYKTIQKTYRGTPQLAKLADRDILAADVDIINPKQADDWVSFQVVSADTKKTFRELARENKVRDLQKMDIYLVPTKLATR